ncbi:MAG: hypothetical protein ACJ8E0_09330, partial [Sphingomicrobium sp.]
MGAIKNGHLRLSKYPAVTEYARSPILVKGFLLLHTQARVRKLSFELSPLGNPAARLLERVDAP